jgi:3',5'-cyclic AMP phosphodiesterase CpdA
VSEYLLVQISDVHLTLDGVLGHAPRVRPRDNLVRGLRLIEAAGIRPDVVLLTGDLADAGDGACYDDLADLVARAAATSGASTVFVPGNHDDRAAFRRHLLGEGPSASPINQVHWRGGLRILSLDSTVPGHGHGELDARTLGFLRSELAEPAPHGSVVALHHPPIPSPVEPMTRMGLRNPAALRDALAGSDVRIVLCGHNHHEALGMIGSIPVWVSPSAAYRLDTTATDVLRGIPGSAFSRIDLSADNLTATVVTIRPR